MKIDNNKKEVSEFDNNMHYGEQWSTQDHAAERKHSVYIIQDIIF